MDEGSPLIGVSFATLPGIFCRYQVRRRDAIRGILRSWRSDPKISAATIVRTGNATTADIERVKPLQDLAEAEQVESEIVTLPECGVAAFWQLLCADVTRGALLLAPAASMLAKHDPEMVAGVLNTCRVALIDGPLDLPVTEETRGATIDLVTVDWAPIAKRIADDTLTGDALTKSDPVVFKAKHRLQVRLDGY